MYTAEVLKSVFFPQERNPCVDTGRSVVKTDWAWESPEATGRVYELKRLWLLLLIPHKPLPVHAQGGSFPFSALSSEQSSSSLPQISSAPAHTSMPFSLQSLLSASPLLSKHFDLWSASLLKGSSLHPIQTNSFSRLYPSLSQALSLSWFTTKSLKVWMMLV